MKITQTRQRTAENIGFFSGFLCIFGRYNQTYCEQDITGTCSNSKNLGFQNINRILMCRDVHRVAVDVMFSVAGRQSATSSQFQRQRACGRQTALCFSYYYVWQNTPQPSACLLDNISALLCLKCTNTQLAEKASDRSGHVRKSERVHRVQLLSVMATTWTFSRLPPDANAAVLSIFSAALQIKMYNFRDFFNLKFICQLWLWYNGGGGGGTKVEGK